MPKFLIPSIYNNHRVETENGFIKQNGLGSGLTLEFMLPQHVLAAQNAGYETYGVLYDTVRRAENGTIKADLVKIELGNKELIDRIMESEENFRGLTTVFDRALARKRQDLLAKTETLQNKITEFSAIELRSAEQDLELKRDQDDLLHSQSLLSNDKNWHYSVWHCQLALGSLDQQILERKDPEIISYLDDLAAQNPPIFWDKESPFLSRTRINNVDLKEFLEVDASQQRGTQNENIFYIRDFKEGGQYSEINDCFRELENSGVKFPTSTITLDLHEKLVVRDNEALSTLTLPMSCSDISDSESLINFYRENCTSEGLVIKPYYSFGGKGILSLEAGISDADLPQKIAELLTKAQEIEKRFRENDVSGTVDYSKFIAQKKLFNLDNDNVLYAGDIRFSSINGRLVGAALRYKEGSGDQVLSYAPCRNILPENKSFTAENVSDFVERARLENNQNKIDYYENLQRTFETATQVNRWCKENGHFHVGFDVLIGRGSAGKWNNCLTELNVGWPDCIPETRWINSRCGANQDLVRICDTIIRDVANNNFISPLKLNRDAILSTHPSHLSSRLFLAQNHEPVKLP